MPVALYARISRDPAEQRVGVDDQLRRLTAYAAATWPGAEVVAWDDNDITAADPDGDRKLAVRHVGIVEGATEPGAETLLRRLPGAHNSLRAYSGA